MNPGTEGVPGLWPDTGAGTRDCPGGGSISPRASLLAAALLVPAACPDSCLASNAETGEDDEPSPGKLARLELSSGRLGRGPAGRAPGVPEADSEEWEEEEGKEDGALGRGVPALGEERGR